MKEHLKKQFLIKTDDKGFSLVEIIIAVAIMSILIGVTGYGLSLVSGRPAEECAQKLASSIQHARTITLGKNKTSIKISMNAQGQIVATEVSEQLLDNDGTSATDTRESIVGAKDVSVICTIDGGSNVTITGSNTVELEFDRGSGALSVTKVNGLASSGHCKSITISKANTTKRIVIIPVTGKVSIENVP